MLFTCIGTPKQGFFLSQKRKEMKCPQNAAKLAALTEFIDSYYGEELDKMIRQLHEIIYMLHYMNPDVFSQENRLEKAFLLHCIVECLSDKPDLKEV